MFINTVESIKMGRKIHEKYGSWEAARAAGAVRPITVEEEYLKREGQDG